jgi:periodic tryptophan protein 2
VRCPPGHLLLLLCVCIQAHHSTHLVCGRYGSVYAQGNVLFTPDGNSLVSPVGNRVTVFDLVNQKCTTLPFENLANITRIALSPDGRVLVTVDERGRALLVNFKRGTVLAHFSFKKAVASLEFSPDGQYLAASHGSKIQFWRAPALKREFAPFELHRVLGGPTDDVVSIQWHSSSAFVIAACADNTARIFSVDPVQGWQPVTLAGHKDVLVAAFFGKEPGTVLTVSRDGSLFQWRSEGLHATAGDISTSWVLKSRHYFKQNKVASVQFHPRTGVLTVGFVSGVFGLYELPSFIAIHTLSFSDHRITTAAVNASGDWLALGSSRMGQLLVWEWQSETYVLKQQGHSYGMSCSAFSSDGALVATGGEDGKVKLWNTTTGFCFVTFGEHEAAVTGLQFLPQGNGVISCSLDGSVRAHDLVRYKNFRTMTTPQPRTLVSLAVDPSGTVIAAGSQDSFEIYVWQLQTGKLLDVLAGHEGPVCALAFSPNQSILVSGSWDRSVMVWDIFKTKTAVDTLQLGSDVLALCYRPDGKAIVASTLDGQLQFWDPMNALCIGSITGRRDIAGGRRQTDLTNAAQAASAQRFNSVVFSADGHFVIAAGNSKYICIYDAVRMLLYNRVCCSRNQSLDGVMTILSGRNMTEAGARARIMHSDALEKGGIEDRLDESLPGVKRGDMTQRNTLPAMRCSCVAVSPTGKAWSCVTTEGLLMYR